MADKYAADTTSSLDWPPGPGSSSTATAAAAGVDGESSGMKEQDRLLPIANVGRIMKQILPSNAKISKEAKETMQESVSEFISFVTGEASDKCRKEKRKTINGDDICSALAALGFDNYAEPMRRYLHNYRLQAEEGDSKAAAASSSSRHSRNKDYITASDHEQHHY